MSESATWWRLVRQWSEPPEYEARTFSRAGDDGDRWAMEGSRGTATARRWQEIGWWPTRAAAAVDEMPYARARAQQALAYLRVLERDAGCEASEPKDRLDAVS